MKNLFFLLSTFLFGLSLHAQTYSLSGQITQNGEPVPGINISIHPGDYKTISDFEGFYSLSLPSGTYTISVNGLQQIHRDISLESNKTLDFDLGEIPEKLNEIFISGFRVSADFPLTHSNLSREEIEERNLGQDIPILMDLMPNVVTTSDAGAGIGYTGIRVRGSDATRVNVTMNGVPLNDAESHSTIWVNLGDFTNSIQDLQLQRGVGTSTNGAGAFGASLNVLTKKYEEKPGVEINNTFGSFNTHKHHLGFDSGRLNDHFFFSGNFSLLKSDGYRDRSFSDLKSYFLQGVYENDNTLIELLGFGGSEKTYQAYYGISAEEMKQNRRYNPAGMYTDEDGNIRFYDNQTDNYAQNHYQLLWNQRYSGNWTSNMTLHYTRGKGYYQSYRPNADLETYGLSYFEHEGELYTKSDLIDQKWLDNHFYGMIMDVQYRQKGLNLILGGGFNQYKGDHFGNVIYTQFAYVPQSDLEYYNNDATKNDFNIYGKATVSLTSKLKAFADLQVRTITYKTGGVLENGQDFDLKDKLVFFNPKLGLTWQINTQHQLYTSYARANREPGRTDYKSNYIEDPSKENYPGVETLNDFELGWRLKSTDFQLNTNLYYMDYHNQLVLTGAIDNEGRFLRTNSGESYRLGLEVEAGIKLSRQFDLLPNISLSQNKNRNFVSLVDGEAVNFGNTHVSFSPNIIAGNSLKYKPMDNLQISLLTKIVGSQYLSNIDAPDSKLDAYWVHNLNIQYRLKKVSPFKEIVLTALINNIFNEKYISNGYYAPEWGASYYPQAGINFLTGVGLKF